MEESHQNHLHLPFLRNVPVLTINVHPLPIYYQTNWITVVKQNYLRLKTLYCLFHGILEVDGFGIDSFVEETMCNSSFMARVAPIAEVVKQNIDLLHFFFHNTFPQQIYFFWMITCYAQNKSRNSNKLTFSNGIVGQVVKSYSM